MNLKILLPSQVFADEHDVMRIVVATSDGSWGILPCRQDCMAILVPGILTFETAAAGVVYAALDVGVLVKTGAEVSISVRRAVRGTDLASLLETVERQYSVLDQAELDVRRVSEKLETGFLRRMVELHCE